MTIIHDHVPAELAAERTGQLRPPDTSTSNGATPRLTLRDFAPGGTHEASGAVTGIWGDLVVLAYGDDPDTVTAYSLGGTITVPAATPATPMTDPEHSDTLQRSCLTHLLDQLRRTRLDHDIAVATHTRVLEEIRRYAIDQHLDDQFCRDGLNTFLQTFGMPTYDPRVKVTYTITGSYEVDTADPESAERDARYYLKVDLSEVDGVIDDTDTFTVEITDTTALDT